MTALAPAVSSEISAIIIQANSLCRQKSLGFFRSQFMPGRETRFARTLSVLAPFLNRPRCGGGCRAATTPPRAAAELLAPEDRVRMKSLRRWTRRYSQRDEFHQR